MLHTMKYATLALALLFTTAPASSAVPPEKLSLPRPKGAKETAKPAEQVAANASEKPVEVVVVLSDKEAASLGKPERIGKLKLTGDRVTNASLKSVRALPQVGVLSIESTQITNAGLDLLKEAANVRSLRLWQASFTDAAFQRVKKITGLEALDLEGTESGGEELAQLADLPKLQTLTLGPLTEDAQLAALGKLAALQDLDLRGCKKLSDAGLRHLQGLTKLQTLSLPPQIAAEAEADLQKKLPNCKVQR